MSKLGSYDNLNKNEKFNTPLDIEEVAQKIEQMHFGAHRFLSALVRIRRADKFIEEAPGGKMLTDGIEDLLNKGGF